ncbi:DUF1189 family protein [Aquibacillus saliphilus]|uniref:DUF1189 family protein n=1 Tax=Aquibacillus saliphilus TaxID=1909422 RepID=UPI001CF06ECB|nr:DUF1189 family protein [Aquibacillus saliphilus]
MDLIKIGKQSIALPKKQAVFYLNRVSMRDTLVYIFLLIFIVFLPEGIKTLFAENSLQSELQSMYFLQMVLFYPLYIIFTGLMGISILAFFGLLLSTLLKRKLAYSHLWKMVAFALTIPLILTMLVSIIGVGYWLFSVLFLFLFYVILYKMIVVYPKRKNA